MANALLNAQMSQVSPQVNGNVPSTSGTSNTSKTNGTLLNLLNFNNTPFVGKTKSKGNSDCATQKPPPNAGNPTINHKGLLFKLNNL